jgi:hypothetical protein
VDYDSPSSSSPSSARAFPLHPRGDAEADFFGVALGVKGEQASEDLVAELGRPLRLLV